MNRPRSGRGRRLVAGVLAGTLLGTTLAACGQEPRVDADGTTVLRLADSFPTTHPVGVGGITPFQEYLAKHGPDAGLSVDYFANGQLGDQGDIPALLRSGVTDLAMVSPGYVGAELPLSNVGDLPGLVTDACVGADAVMRTMRPGGTLFEEELKPHGVRPLWVAILPGYELLGTQSSVSVPSQARGRLLRSTGGVADRAVDELGASGVSMPLGELFEAVSRGTVNGTVASPVSIATYKLGEVLDFSTIGANLGSFTITFSISENVWEGLDSDQRGVLADASKIAQQGACTVLNDQRQDAIKEMQGQGVKLVRIGAEERPKWDAIAEPVREGWARDLEGTGRPGHKVLAEFEANLAAAKAAAGSTDGAEQ